MTEKDLRELTRLKSQYRNEFVQLEYEYLHVPSGTHGTRKFEGTAHELLLKLNAWNRQFPGTWVYWHKTLGRMYP